MTSAPAEDATAVGDSSSSSFLSRSESIESTASSQLQPEEATPASTATATDAAPAAAAATTPRSSYFVLSFQSRSARPSGLLYQASTQTFILANRDGTRRTVGDSGQCPAGSLAAHDRA